VASAVKTKIVALFGPTDPKRHMPPGTGAVVLSRSLECAPCYQGICKNAEPLACLRKISVNEVFESVRRQLGVPAAAVEAG
jgi:ADP-heptose:LPS heptosyltransferase